MIYWSSLGFVIHSVSYDLGLISIKNLKLHLCGHVLRRDYIGGWWIDSSSKEML